MEITRCVYCGNPSPKVYTQGDQQSKLSINFFLRLISLSYSSSSSTILLQSPVVVDCNFCGRCYTLVDDRQYAAETLKRLRIEENQIESLALEFMRDGIEPRDIFNNSECITIPIRRWNDIKKRLSHLTRKVYFEIHIIFRPSSGSSYYLSAYKNYKTGDLRAGRIVKIP